VANHEAGHAAYTLLHSEDMVLVWAGIMTDAEGYTSGMAIILPGKPADFREAVTLIGEMYAGEAAEEILSGGPIPDGSLRDYADAAKAAKRFMGRNSPHLPQTLATAKMLARYVLAKHPAKLRRLANALKRRKFLTGEEARLIWNKR
jgi:hypothetical protein